MDHHGGFPPRQHVCLLLFLQNHTPSPCFCRTFVPGSQRSSPAVPPSSCLISDKASRRRLPLPVASLPCIRRLTIGKTVVLPTGHRGQISRVPTTHTPRGKSAPPAKTVGGWTMYLETTLPPPPLYLRIPAYIQRPIPPNVPWIYIHGVTWCLAKPGYILPREPSYP